METLADSVKGTQYVYNIDMGTTILGDGGTRFRIWAPSVKNVVLILTYQKMKTLCLEMKPEGEGWFQASAREAQPGDRYLYEMDGELRPSV